VLYYLSDEKILKQELFDLNFVKKIKNDFFNGKKEFGVKIWYLLMFQMWFEKWMR